MYTAVHSGLLGDLPVVEAVKRILDAGIDRAELNGEELPWTGPHVDPTTSAQVRRALVDLGPFHALAAHHRDFGHPDPQVRGEALKWTRGMVELAHDLGTDFVHVIPGSNASADATLVALTEAVEMGRQYGITIALEAIVNQALATTADVEMALAAVPDLRVNFDASHLHVHDHATADSARRLGPWVDHIAVKDARGVPDNFAFTAYGAGEIDFDAILVELRRHGFDGGLSIEHESHWFDGDTRSADEVLTEARTVLDGLIDRHRNLATAAGGDR